MSDFTPGSPTVWNPTTVIHPVAGIPFTDITAWHFIADKVEEGWPVRVIKLRKPLDEVAYEMKFPGAPGQPQIYVKVCLRKQRIFGRSFHNDTAEEVIHGSR